MLRLSVVAAACVLCACSVRRMAVNALGDALSGPGVLASEEDYELARQAAPFGLKTLESLHREAPDDVGVLVALAAGFTQYAYAFVQQDADRLEEKSVVRAREERQRARRLYLRGRGYGLAGIDRQHPGFAEGLAQDPATWLKRLTPEDVPLAYWTAAAWAAAATADKSDVTLLGDLGLVETMMKRALELDAGYDEGALHEFFVAFDAGRSEAMGGSLTRAQGHLDRALVASRERKVGVLVTWAETACVQRQDAKAFRAFLDRALAFDVNQAPEHRLANVVAQRRARWLRGRIPELFLSED